MTFPPFFPFGRLDNRHEEKVPGLRPNRNATVMGGGRTGVLLFEPLHDGSPEEWVNCRPAFAEAATRRQAQGFSKNHTGSTVTHFTICE